MESIMMIEAVNALIGCIAMLLLYCVYNGQRIHRLSSQITQMKTHRADVAHDLKIGQRVGARVERADGSVQNL